MDDRLSEFYGYDTDGSEDPVFDRIDQKVERTAVFNDAMLLAMKDQLQHEANRLQDQLDAYNAAVQIDFESPLN